MENSRNKQFINFKLRTVLSSMMKSRAISSHPALSPGMRIIPLSGVPMLHTLPALWSLNSHLGYQNDYHSITVLVCEQSLFY